MSSPPAASLAVVFLVVCIDLLGFGLVLPLLPIYGQELLGGYSRPQAGAILGLLMSSFTIMQFLFAPVWGRLSDRVGRRPVLLVGLAGSALFYGLFGVATSMRSLSGLFLARIGAGVAGATIPTAQAYIADVTPRQHRARGMALVGASFGLGFTLGPLIGALAMLLARDAGLSPWPGYLASFLSASALLTALVLLPESLRPETSERARRHFDLSAFRHALGIPSIGLLLGTAFLSTFSLANLESTISLAIQAKLEPVATEAPPEQWRLMVRLFLVFAYVGLIQSLVQGVLVRRLASRWSEGALGRVGIGVSILGFATLGLVVACPGCGVGWLMLAVAIEVGGIAFTFPAIQSLLSRRSDPSEQGGILGAAESVHSLARITGVLFGVWLYKAGAPAWPFTGAAAMMLLALLLLWLGDRRGGDWPG